METLPKNNEQKSFKDYFRGEKSLFMWIAVISIVNTFLFYINFDFGISFWLSITQFIDVLSIYETELKNKIIFFVISLLISVSFLIIGYFSQKEVKWIFKLGFIFILLDFIIAIYFFDIFGIIVHAVLLKWLYDIYNEKNNIN